LISTNAEELMKKIGFIEEPSGSVVACATPLAG
jgi:hypothetical protein